MQLDSLCIVDDNNNDTNNNTIITIFIRLIIAILRTNDHRESVSGCFGEVGNISWNCDGTVTGTAAEHSLNSHGTLTGLSRNSHHTLTELSRNSHGTLTELTGGVSPLPESEGVMRGS